MRLQAHRLVLATVLLLLGLGGCNFSSRDAQRLKLEQDDLPIERDWNDIIQSGELNAITIYNSTGYFLYRGQPMGFEYDLLKHFCDKHKLTLRIKVAKDIDELFDMLNRGEGDVVAYGLAVTQGRKEYVRFTEHQYVTHQVLVQRKPQGWRSMTRDQIDKALVREPLQLIGDTVHLRRKSSYAERLESLEEEIGGRIVPVYLSGQFTTEEIMMQVAEGEIKYTMADENLAEIVASHYPQLDIKTSMSFNQRIAWAVRKNSPELEAEINNWLKPLRKTNFFAVTYRKYFKYKQSYAARIKSPFYSKSGGKISPYDQLIKKYARQIGWDWRLLAALIYQESRFDTQAKSWAGASGLMQILPSTAQQFGGIDSSNYIESNLRAGTAYLKYLQKKWAHIPDTVQQLKFTMASYNCGYAHLLDAQRLTSEFNMDSMQYDDNVEIWLKRLSKKELYLHPRVRYGYVRGSEPYAYVRDIFLRYAHYKQFIRETPTPVSKANSA